MSVGIAIVGNQVTVSVGGDALIGVTSKNIELNGEILDTSDDAASGWAEKAAVHGLKSVSSAMSGLLKNLEIVGVFFGASQMVEIVWTFPDGVSTPTTLTFDAVMGPISIGGDSNTGYTWDTTFESSGEVVYVAAT